MFERGNKRVLRRVGRGRAVAQHAVRGAVRERLVRAHKLVERGDIAFLRRVNYRLLIHFFNIDREIVWITRFFRFDLMLKFDILVAVVSRGGGMADAKVSKTFARFGHVGSTPYLGTRILRYYIIFQVR